jgi:hypothetical protein
VYNWALEAKTKAYCQDEESLSFTDLSSRLTSKKKGEETEWLSEVSASVHDKNQVCLQKSRFSPCFELSS